MEHSRLAHRACFGPFAAAASSRFGPLLLFIKDFLHCTHADVSLLPPGQSSRLIATTGLSFCRTTREQFPTLQPPDEEGGSPKGWTFG